MSVLFNESAKDMLHSIGTVSLNLSTCTVDDLLHALSQKFIDAEERADMHLKDFSDIDDELEKVKKELMEYRKLGFFNAYELNRVIEFYKEQLSEKDQTILELRKTLLKLGYQTEGIHI